MKPIKHLPKITQELEGITNDKSRTRLDQEYQKMIRRVLDEVFLI